MSITQYDFNPTASLDILAKVACVSARKAAQVLQAGGSLGGEAARAFALCEDANRCLTEAMHVLASCPDPMPEDGTPFWVTSATADGDVKLVRLGVLPGKEHWGKVMHTVEGNVWVSRDYYQLWWPLSLYPLAETAPAKKPRKSK